MSEALDDSAWLRRQLAGDDDAAAAGEVVEAADPDLAEFGDVPPDYEAGVHDLDGEATEGGERRPARFDHRVAAGFGGVAAAGVVVALVGAVLLYGDGEPDVAPQRDSVAGPAATTATVTPPAPRPAADPGTDRPLPFTASAPCPPGSTSAQTLAGADPMNAFVCVRDGVDGQRVDIDLGKTFVISAISITPGWIGQDSGGVSQWTQHRVVTRVQYMLINGEDVTVLTQDTGNVHGEAVQPVKRVLASRIVMLILQTSHPPAQTPTTTPAPGGLLDGVFDPVPPPALALSGDPRSGDPVDATFAISNLKIIGHEAI